MKQKFYSLENIDKYDALYNVIFGERSNGKTFSILKRGLEKYIKSGYVEQLAIIRRWDEDFKGKNGAQQFSALIENENTGNIVEKLTKGEYNNIVYNSRRWYLAYTGKEDGKDVKKIHPDPFAFAFSLTNDEHYKSFSYPNITTILYDEFITRKYYLPDEFIIFQSILSTIIRQRDNVKIYMCGNTINPYCPHFKEMGLNNIKNMKKGTIDVYTYGDSGLVVAVEYSDFPMKKKKSDKYFAFDNPKLKMITTGAWEINVYPHLPYKYKPNNIIYKYYITFDDEKLQANVIKVNGCIFTYIHRKTTEINEDKYLVYQQEHSPKRNYRRKLTKCSTELEKKLYKFFFDDKVFYQDNEVGEIVRNYLAWCKTSE